MAVAMASCLMDGEVLLPLSVLSNTAAWVVLYRVQEQGAIREESSYIKSALYLNSRLRV